MELPAKQLTTKMLNNMIDFKNASFADFQKNIAKEFPTAALCQNERKRNDVEVSGLVYHTHTDLVFVQNCNLLLAVA